MTDTTPTPRSRRVLLTAALGAGAATVATALARPLAVQAANNDIVQVGHTYTADTVTKFDTGTTSHVALSGASASSTGVFGISTSSLGVHGLSGSGDGVLGNSTSGIGVDGISSSGAGVSGSSLSGDGVRGSGATAGVRGTTLNGSGVQGFSGPVPVSTVSARTGVFGYSDADLAAIGVKGESVGGFGVVGVSTTNLGVQGTSTSGAGVRGSSSSGHGLSGSSTSAIGVFGSSASDVGVAGTSSSAIGVLGDSSAADKPAILGRSVGSSTGVQGFSGPGVPPAAPAKTGVHGYAAQDANANGVKGQTTIGRGVFAVATSGTGAYGFASSGIGTRGYAATGTGLHASTSDPKIGTAFRAVGKVKLDNCAGVATIASGTNSVTVTPGINLTASSAVVATLMASAGGITTVHRVVVDAVADTFAIFLTANATAAVKVAWHVFG